MRRIRARFVRSALSLAVTRSLPSQALSVPSQGGMPSRSPGRMGGLAIIPVTSYPGGASAYMLGCAPLNIYTPPAVARSSSTTTNVSK